MTEVIYIDINGGLQRMMNNNKLYTKLLDKFKNDPSMASIESAMAEGNMENARAAAHSLKGISANLSLTELYKQSMELESQIKENSVKPDSLENLKTVYAKTIVEVDKTIIQLS